MVSFSIIDLSKATFGRAPARCEGRVVARGPGQGAGGGGH